MFHDASTAAVLLTMIRYTDSDSIEQILLRHQTQLKRAFDLQESPKVTLMLPGSFSFEPADEPSKQIKISPPLNQKTKVVTKTKSKKALAKNRVEQQSLYAAQVCLNLSQ